MGKRKMLSLDEVKTVITLAGCGTKRVKIAQLMGVHKSTVSNILNGIHYKWLPRDLIELEREMEIEAAEKKRQDEMEKHFDEVIQKQSARNRKN